MMHGMEIPTRKRGRRPHPGKARALQLAQDPSLTMTEIALTVGASIGAVSGWISDTRENPPPSADAGEKGQAGTSHNPERSPTSLDDSTGLSASEGEANTSKEGS